MVYRLFSNLVTYSENYQGLEEVWTDPECRDAVGTVKLPRTTGAGNFLYNPFWIDCAIHLAGFLVNSSLKYPEDIACLSTGFESWRSLEELQADEIYTTYVSMQEDETPNMLSGTAYVYNSRHKLVQVTTGIRFQKMKKLVFNSILRPASSHTDRAVAWRNEAGPMRKITRASISRAPTPAAQSSGCSEDERGEQSTGNTTPASSVDDDERVTLLDTFLSVVASEIGCSVSDMEPDTSFADLGMDSLMAITIIATFQKDTGVELPATFFLEHITVTEAKEALPRNTSAESIGKPFEEPRAQLEALPTFGATLEVPTVTRSFEPVSTSVDEQAPSSTSLVPPHARPTESVKPSKAVLLHGSPSSMGSLFIIDMAVPKSCDDAIVTTPEQLLEAGFLPPPPSGGRLTPAQKEHLACTVRAMTAYSPAPCSPDKRPKKTVLVSSRTPLASGRDSELARWAKGNDSISRGWEELVGSVVEVHQVDTDHSSLFKFPASSCHYLSTALLA